MIGRVLGGERTSDKERKTTGEREENNKEERG